ncbi:hypothetical protein [Ignatzschineria cameli]|uniref:Uncharacterized protein n=1 Tax=Ignatzschineria cameli TaxID=2182793 RepID=A0A2U2AQK6_9GAMM|nr:hypothetical protein DC080_09555 [Ignatzschineria cameli]PWD85893.1 hypothetical protein DC077_07370 [Ignatzschineria cameli]PWD89523.1 hypothetical protein DC079_06995 [Ignatzschineria cameli]PWD90995.1 hypothetical protein DC081_06705 [Ignatzschineria cameli]PWD91783.1 hypothetical protein DC078_06990 [Ignatzschineria cameli]
MFIIFFFTAFTSNLAYAQSDDEIKNIIIQQSIASYPKSCACPYNSAKNGSRCGKRSAYSKKGGYTPKCYPEDISPREIKEWKQRNNSRKR